jgi:hypothetical protein
MAIRKLHNSEYYTLLFAALLLRVAFYMLTAVIDEQYIYEMFFDNASVQFEHLESAEREQLSRIVNLTDDILYRYGMAHFLLFELLAVLMIVRYYRGKQRASKIISITGTALFAALASSLLMYEFLYTRAGSFTYIVFLRIIEPLIVYAVPLGIIIYFIFTIPVKRIGAYIKSALLKPTSIIFFISGFLLIGVYIYLVVWWENAYAAMLATPGATEEEAMDLLRVREQIEIFLYSMNTFILCGTALCFYRSVKLMKSKGEVT